MAESRRKADRPGTDGSIMTRGEGCGGSDTWPGGCRSWMMEGESVEDGDL